jgi:hypothetical protein
MNKVAVLAVAVTLLLIPSIGPLRIRWLDGEL